MYEVSVIPLQGILEGNQELWKKNVDALLNRRWKEGWEIMQVFNVGENLDAEAAEPSHYLEVQGKKVDFQYI